ncbi:MAG: fibronectin type III domain-containing protein [Deltaproteobacteria bacterium]|nr:fibronectin type III domain-containing protein [Deltaproteobacteria bacterium]
MKTRMGLAPIALAAAATVLFTAMPGDAHAAATGVRLSFTDDTSTTMTVSWNTDAAADTEVRYGTSPGAYTATAPGTSFQATSGLGFVHEATLTKLSPSTVYYYVAGSAAGGYTKESSFMTGPEQDQACGSFKFVFTGDNRPDPTFGGGQNWPQILGQSVGQNPEFALNGGDLVTDGDNIDGWNDFLGWTETVASTIAFMPTIGNHDNGPGDGDTANYNQLFALPRSQGTYGSGTEDYYFFTYGNAIIVALSTEGFKGGSGAFGNQAAWLDEVFTANPRKWKFVFYHSPSYTKEVVFSVSHPPNEEGQNAALIPIFDKHHVDVVFTSHNHWYERFEPTACATKGDPGSSDPCPVGASNYAQGTVFYVSGGAGAFTIPAFLCGTLTGRAKCSGDHHYIVADIKNETLKLDTWAAYPQNNQIIDTITITKAAESCAAPPDAGTPDTGVLDTGVPDSGIDASVADADGDAGTTPDGAPQPDASGTDQGPATDQGQPDPDAAEQDTGTPPGDGSAGSDGETAQDAALAEDSGGGQSDAGGPGTRRDAGGGPGGGTADGDSAGGCSCQTVGLAGAAP